MKDAVRRGSPRAVRTTAGAGLALALLTGGAGAAAAPGSPALTDAALAGSVLTDAALPGSVLTDAALAGSVLTDAGQAAADAASPADFFVLLPGQSRRGLPPGVELDDTASTPAGGAWTPAEGLLYVVTLGSSSCPRIPDPVARNTMAGAGLAADEDVGDIDVTLPAPEPGGACTTDWVPTTTVVAVPEGKDHGGPVTLRIGEVGKTDLSPRAVPGATGPAAWIDFDG